jgi:Secretion system C-terminal sorting domain
VKKTIIILFLLVANLLIGQNLVPNPSFEDTIYCPTTNNDIGAVASWFNFGNSPDYLNACAPNGISVPNSSAGYQFANSGVAMAGVITQMTNTAPSGANYREYIGVQLINPLVISQKYFFSFFINYSGYLNGFEQIAANKIGMKFSSFSYSEFSPPLTDNFAHLYTDSIVTDTVGWYKISGSFVTDSSYQFVILGNFFDSISTDTLNLGGVPFGSAGAYYYIDDVCVTTDSSFNELWTGITVNTKSNKKKNAISIYPNPSSTHFTIESLNKPYNLNIYNTVGQLLYTENNISGTNKQVDVSKYSKGLLFIGIESADEVYYHKLIKE